MTTFHLIRHAEKDSPPDLIPARAGGVHLSARGRLQATSLAVALRSEPIRRVFSSPMERARETAEAIARTLGLQVQVSEALNEFDFGTWTNRTIQDLAREITWDQFNGFRVGTRVPGGETMLEVQSRFVSAMLGWRDEFPDDAIALVSHGDPIRAALAAFAGVPLDLGGRFEIDSPSDTVIALDQKAVRILAVNWCPRPV